MPIFDQAGHLRGSVNAILREPSESMLRGYIACQSPLSLLLRVPPLPLQLTSSGAPNIWHEFRSAWHVGSGEQYLGYGEELERLSPWRAANVVSALVVSRQNAYSASLSPGTSFNADHHVLVGLAAVIALVNEIRANRQDLVDTPEFTEEEFTKLFDGLRATGDKAARREVIEGVALGYFGRIMIPSQLTPEELVKHTRSNIFFADIPYDPERISATFLAIAGKLHKWYGLPNPFDKPSEALSPLHATGEWATAKSLVELDQKMGEVLREKIPGKDLPAVLAGSSHAVRRNLFNHPIVEGNVDVADAVTILGLVAVCRAQRKEYKITSTDIPYLVVHKRKVPLSEATAAWKRVLSPRLRDLSDSIKKAKEGALGILTGSHGRNKSAGPPRDRVRPRSARRGIQDRAA